MSVRWGKVTELKATQSGVKFESTSAKALQEPTCALHGLVTRKQGSWPTCRGQSWRTISRIPGISTSPMVYLVFVGSVQALWRPKK